MKRREMLHDDDCMGTCIESILELPKGTVPNFVPTNGDGNGQLKAANLWLRKRGWSLITLQVSSKKFEGMLGNNFGDGYCIIETTLPASHHEDCNHCVVGRIRRGKLTIEHDPGGWGRCLGRRRWRAVYFIVNLKRIKVGREVVKC